MNIVQIFLLLTAPGIFVLNRIPVKIKDEMDIFEKIGIVFSISIIITTILGVILVSFKMFSISIIILIYVILLALVIKRTNFKNLSLKNISYKSLCSKHTIWSIVVVLTLLIAIYLFMQPTEYFVGGRDPGVYISTGINIANTGEIIIDDDLLNEVIKEYKDIFQIKDSKFPGFYITNNSSRYFINPQFFHAYPILLAISYRLTGIDYFLYITPIIAICALLSIYMVVKKFFNEKIASTSIFLITINISEIWYARGPYSEVLSQLAIWTGIYLVLLSSENKNKLLGIISGIVLSATILIRIDSILILFPLFIYFTILYYDGDFKDKWPLQFMVAFLVFGIGILGYALNYAYRYTNDNLVGEFLNDKVTLLQLVYIVCVLGILSIIIVMAFRKYGQVLIKWLKNNKTKIIIILSVIIILTFFYLYFIRPNTDNPTRYSEKVWFAVGQRTYQEESLIRIGWYISPISIILALIGFVHFINFRSVKRNLLLILFTFSFLGLYLYNQRIYIDHFWAVRRNVPYIIPIFIVFASYTLCEIFFKIRYKRYKNITVILSSIIFISLCVHSARIAYPFIQYTEYEGLKDSLKDFSALFNENDILIFEKVDDIEKLIGTPMQFVFGKDVLTLKEDYNSDKLLEFISRYNAKGKNIFLITTMNSNLILDNKKYPTYVNNYNIITNIAERTSLSIPNNIINISWDLFTYKINNTNIKTGEIDIGEPFDIDENSKGFYNREKTEINKVNIRWTSKNADLYIPIGHIEDAGVVDIKARALRPENIKHTEVSIFINGVFIQRINILNKSFYNYKIFVPEEIIKKSISDKCKLTIISDTWVPKEYGINDDIRELGIQVDKVAVYNN